MRKKKSLKFIESHNSIPLLNFIIGLQLIPGNHGKNIRIEQLATHLIKNLNNKSNGELILFKKYIDKEYAYNMMEDIPENLFCENVVFYGGNYTVFSGVHSYAVEIFRNLTETIFTQNNNLPNNFKNHIYSGITLILELGQRLANKFKIEGNIQGGEGDFNLEFPVFGIDTSFSIEEINFICKDHNINPYTITDFIISPDDNRFSIKDPDLNPLLYFPIVLFDNKFYFIFISNQINALNEFILRSSNLHECNEKLVQLYHEKIWYDAWGACDKMGWGLLDIELPKNNHSKILQERIFQFDNNRIAYVSYLHNEFTNDKHHESPSFGLDVDINQRVMDVISKLKSDKTFEDYKFLSLITFENMGRNMFFGIGAPQEKELRITFSIHQFLHLTSTENWEELSLWKFAKSYEAFSKYTKTAFADTLDIYSIYKSNNESFYFGDNKRPNLFNVIPGEGSRLIKEGKIQKDRHGIIVEIDNNLGYFPCERYADYAPLYRPLYNIGYYAICLEIFDFPIWVVNRQVRNKEMASEVRNFAEAIVFWLFKLNSKIADSLNASIINCFEIEIVLDKELFKNKRAIEVQEAIENTSYTFQLFGRILKINIPFSKIKSFIGGNNNGEREMMKALLHAFNLVEGISFSEEYINESVDYAIPLGNAKMILLSDTHKDPFMNNRWLIKPLYISESEIDHLLDEIPALIEEKTYIPENIESLKSKTELFNIATQVLLDKLRDEIKVFEFEFLLSTLIKLHETLVWRREHDKTIIPAQILCFGDKEEKLKEIFEEQEKLVKTSLATRCLIEFLAAQPTKGSIKASYDEIDRLLVLMHELTNYGFLSDAVYFKLANPIVGKLESGRIGISRDFFDNKLKPFAEASRTEEVDNYIQNFENRFEFSDLSTKKELNYQKEVIEFEEIDKSFLTDWGIGYLNIYKFCYSCYVLCVEKESSIISMEEKSLITTLIEEFQLPKNEVIAGIERFSINERPEYLKAPSGYNDNEVFPWKYNREFSFARRFLIKYERDGNTILTWGFRNAISAQKQLDYLLMEGKLNNGGKNIEKLLGTYRAQKGKEYRTQVKDWLKTHNELRVVDYEVYISPNGHLKADINYGDVDILVHDTQTNIIWSLECKDTNKAKNIHEMKKEMDNYLGREGGAGMIKKHILRHEWLVQNKDKICDFLKINGTISIISYILTSEVIPTTYIRAEDLPMPIIAFPNLKREGLKLLYL